MGWLPYGDSSSGTLSPDLLRVSGWMCENAALWGTVSSHFQTITARKSFPSSPVAERLGQTVGDNNMARQSDKIAPSILSADFAKLGEEVDNVLASGAEIVHFDVMDNHYVPNLTIGPLVCEALRKHGVTADIDVHMMVKPVDRIIPDFAKAGATYITFHPEASEHIDRSLQLIRNEGCKSGLVFNPATPLSHLDYVLDKVDMILLMSVNPGFGGQSFIPATLDKLRQCRKLIDDSGLDIRLEIDGGVKVDNIAEIKAAGADTFVSGSGIFGYPGDNDPNRYNTIVDKMKAELAKV
jgi:ribulose-phosphate 3-epimerase